MKERSEIESMGKINANAAIVETLLDIRELLIDAAADRGVTQSRIQDAVDQWRRCIGVDLALDSGESVTLEVNHDDANT